MRILCLIMVGAFLLSIAIAENGNSLRFSSRTSQLRRPRLGPQPRPGLLRATGSRKPDRPVASRRISYHEKLVMGASSAAPNYGQPVQFAQTSLGPVVRHEPKMMIFEPLPKPPRKSSWTDWIPDFFDDDDSGEARPGPLIGPIDMPSMGAHVFIRQNEPTDDDTDHVVIHLIDRKPPPLVQVPIFPTPQPVPLHNQIPIFAKDTVQYAASNVSPKPASPVLQYEVARNEYPSKVANAHSWSHQVNSNSNEIKDQKAQHPPPAVHEMPNDESQSKYTVMILKPGGYEPSNVWGSRPLERGSIGQKGSTLPMGTVASPQLATPTTHRPKPDSPALSSILQYAPLRRAYAPAARRNDSLAPARQPRHQLGQPDAADTSGGLRVVAPPDLHNPGNASQLLHSLMSMTANHTWRSSSSSSSSSVPRPPKSPEAKKPTGGPDPPKKPPHGSRPKLAAVEIIERRNDGVPIYGRSTSPAPEPTSSTERIEIVFAESAAPPAPHNSTNAR